MAKSLILCLSDPHQLFLVTALLIPAELGIPVGPGSSTQELPLAV